MNKIKYISFIGAISSCAITIGAIGQTSITYDKVEGINNLNVKITNKINTPTNFSDVGSVFNPISLQENSVINLTYDKTSKFNDGVSTLLKGGSIANLFDENKLYNNAIDGLKDITVNYDEPYNLKILFGWNQEIIKNNVKIYTHDLASGISYNFDNGFPSFFKIYNLNETPVSIKDISINYSCSRSTGSDFTPIDINTKLVQDYAKELTTSYDYQKYVKPELNKDTVDILVFAGQSNMCGRATLKDSNKDGVVYDIPLDMAYTYSNPNASLTNEHKLIKDPIKQNGSSGYGMIPSIIKSYYELTKTQVAACFKSTGGVLLNRFLPYTYDVDGNKVNNKTSYYKSIVSQVNYTKNQIQLENKKVGHTYLIWCQGESDSTYYGTDYVNLNAVERLLKTEEEKINYYNSSFMDFFNSLKQECGIEKAGIIRIGELKSNSKAHRTIIKGQNILVKENKDVVMLSTAFGNAKTWFNYDGTTTNLMRDEWHYFLKMYNIAGLEAGINMGIFSNFSYQVEPILYEHHNDYLKNISDYNKTLDSYYDLGEYLL